MFINCQDNVIEAINRFEWPSSEIINNLSSKDDSIRIAAAKEIVKWQCYCYQLGIMMNDIRNSSYHSIGLSLTGELFVMTDLNHIIRNISENKSLDLKEEDITKFISEIEFRLKDIKDAIEKYENVSNKKILKSFFDKCFTIKYRILLSLKQLIS